MPHWRSGVRWAGHTWYAGRVTVPRSQPSSSSAFRTAMAADNAGALVRGDKRGWRASDAGTQTIRLIFDRPQNIERIELAFDENASVRTQEFVLRWMPKVGQTREIVRQQWNFSPPATVHDEENFSVQLSGVSTLELIITPNIAGGRDHASLSQLRVA